MRKRGVSPIVAAVLLTAIVVTLGVGVFMWAVGAFTTLGQSIDIFYKLRGEQRLEYLIVEHVRAVNQSALSVFVRNTGSIDVELSAIYVINLKNASQFHRLELSRGQCWIPVGGYVNITVTLPWTLAAGDPYEIKAVTYRGTAIHTISTLPLNVTVVKVEEFKASSFSVVSGSYSGSLSDTYEVDGRYLSVAEARSTANVIKNGGFDEGLKYWTTSSSGIVSVALDTGYGNPKPSVKVYTEKRGSGYGNITQQVEIHHPAQAKLSFDYKVDRWQLLSTGSVSAILKYGTKTLTVISESISGETGWVTKSRNIRFNETGTYELTISVYFNTWPAVSHIVYIDNVRLEVEGYYAEVAFDFNIPIDVSKIMSIYAYLGGYVNGSKFYIYVYNFTAGSWVYLGEFSSTSETLAVYRLPPANSGILSNGLLRVRLCSEVDGIKHAIYVDYIAIEVKYRA